MVWVHFGGKFACGNGTTTMMLRGLADPRVVRLKASRSQNNFLIGLGLRNRARKFLKAPTLEKKNAMV